jgi:hypothetical protein
MDALERSRTLNDVGRFRTPKDWTVTGWSRNINADSAVHFCVFLKFKS